MFEKYKCKVMNAVDGDTFDVAVSLGFKLTYTTRIRILGINTQEMHDKDPEKRARAQRAKDQAGNWVGLICDLIVHGVDKYGRHVCELQHDNSDYGQTMIGLGLADKAVYSIVEGEIVQATLFA